MIKISPATRTNFKQNFFTVCYASQKVFNCTCFYDFQNTFHSRPSSLYVILFYVLSLTLPGLSAGVSGSLDSYCSLKPLCSGMGEVVPARTSPALLPPSPRTVLSLSCFKVSQCINCRDWYCKSYVYSFCMTMNF